jgi:hypothetical protein
VKKQTRVKTDIDPLPDAEILTYEERDLRKLKHLGHMLGFGRVMQATEEFWRESGETPGGEHTVGPCASMMVVCTHNGRDAKECEWCCGSGRVTKRVALAMAGDAELRSDIIAEEREDLRRAYAELDQLYAAEKARVAGCERHLAKVSVALKFVGLSAESTLVAVESAMFGWRP